MDNQRELDYRKQFERFHKANAYNYSCNMTEIAKDLGISRIKLYRWLKGKARLNETQLVQIKKLLDFWGVSVIVISMLHFYAEYIKSFVGKSRLIGIFFKRKVDFLLNAFCILGNLKKNIFSTKATFLNKVAFLF